MTQLLAADEEAEKRRILRRHQRSATGLLVVAAIIFLVFHAIPDPPFLVQLIEAGAEAAVVGGLADWFAVTAIFRHPLGIPIPHTALIPRHKDGLGRGLGNFIERNFLAPELVAQRLGKADLASKLADWLSAQANAHMVAERLVSAVPHALRALDDQQVREFLRRSLHEQIAKVDIAPALLRGLSILTERGYHHELFDRAIDYVRGYLTENEQRIYDLVGERSRWYVPPNVDRTVARTLVRGILQLLDELLERDNKTRQQFEIGLKQMIDDLRESEGYRARMASIRDDVVASPDVQGFLGSVWDDLRDLLIREVDPPSERLVESVAGAIQGLGRTLSSDKEMRDRVNRNIEALIRELIVPWRVEIGRFIADVVKGWDATTVSNRMELTVGRDLQFIRVNGTIVGALVGAGLFLFTTFVY